MWRSKKQAVVACSSAEAKFRATTHAICELLWIKSILADFTIEVRKHVLWYCYNKVAINIAPIPSIMIKLNTGS